MSPSPQTDETAAERINALIKALPPKEGRRSRLGHISIEDFAELLGTTKQRVIDWRSGDAFPDGKNRERLAEVSAGRYRADDFRGPVTAGKVETAARLAALEEEVAVLREALDVARKAQRATLRRLSALEKAAESRPRTQPGGPAKRQAGNGR